MTATAPSTAPIHPATRVGAVHLTVADLGRSIAYYRDAIGLEVLHHEPGRASLGVAGTELVGLVESPGALPARGHTGLFHLAIRVPRRADLARWLVHAARTRVPLSGMSDHFVSEAIYLQDPDDHGIEIYHDRPRSLWEDRVEEMTTIALDVDDVLGELDDPAGGEFAGMPAGTDMGHVHLKVADVPASIAFYRDALGMDLMATYGPQAAFLAAGGYHHHIGANVWQSRGASPPPDGTAALRYATLILPSVDERDRVTGRLDDAGFAPEARADGDVIVTDPSRNVLLLSVE